MAERGEFVGRWRLEEPLGEGATARVWRAVERRDPTDQAAVKVIALGRARSAERFAAEAGMLRSLKHPHIVGIRDSGSLAHHDLVYIAMELVEGEDLADRMARGPMAADEARPLFGALAAALHHAHERGVCHRDLKPRNIRVRPDGEPVVIDFGIALDTGPEALRDEDADELPGTLAYLPPEVFTQGLKPRPHLADIYALGVILFEALTGRRAYPVPPGLDPRRTAERIARAKLDAEPLDPGVPVPADLRETVRRATDPDPELRLANMRTLAERLGVALPTSAVRGRPVGAATGTVWLGDDDLEEDDAALTANDDLPAWSPPPAGVGGSDADAPPVPSRFTQGAATSSPEPVSPAPPPPASPARGRSVARRATPSSGSPPSGDRGTPPPVARSGRGSVASPYGGMGTPTGTPTPLPDEPDEPGDTPAAPGGAPTPRWVYGLVAGLLVGAFGMVAVGVGVWWTLAPAAGSGEGSPISEPPPEAPRTVRLDPPLPLEARAWVDGQAWSPDEGLTPGPHQVVVTTGPGCDGAASQPDACCAVALTALDVLPEQGPVDLALQLPEPIEASRALVMAVATEGEEAVEAGSLTVWVDGEAVEAAPTAPPEDVTVEGQVPPGYTVGWFDLGALPWGERTVRIDRGTCDDAAAGCAGTAGLDAAACPAGCVSVERTATLACGDVPEVLSLALATPATAEPPSPDRGSSSTRRTSSSSSSGGGADDGAPPARAVPRVTFVATVQSGDLAGGDLKRRIGLQRAYLEQCIVSEVGGGELDPYRVALEFRISRRGEVLPASVKLLQSGDRTDLDRCAAGAVKKLTVPDIGKPARAQLVITFQMR